MEKKLEQESEKLATELCDGSQRIYLTILSAFRNKDNKIQEAYQAGLRRAVEIVKEDDTYGAYVEEDKEGTALADRIEILSSLQKEISSNSK